MPSKPFRFTYFRKNASVTPLDSHTFKTKDLKPFRFIHFQESGGGVPSHKATEHAPRGPAFDCQLRTGSGDPLPHQPPLPLLPPMSYNLPHHTGARQRSIPDEA